VRIRTSLEQTRVNLKAEEGRLSRERKLMEAEDTRARAALRLVCSQYGDLDWGETTPLSEIVTEHLANPLRATLGQVTARLDDLKQRALTAESELAALTAALEVSAHQTAGSSEISHALPTREGDPSTPPFMARAIERAAERTAAPRPLRPTRVPDPVHRIVVVKAQLRDLHGHRGVCVCGWRTAVEIGDRSEDQATRLGQAHCDQYEAQRREIRA
jgi:hypothetical protein